MPPPVSRRDFRRQQQFENDLAQQASDRQQQSGMLQMLQSLYGIGQDQQLAPDKLAALRAETAGREAQTAAIPSEVAATQARTAAQQFENQWAQPNAEAAYNEHLARMEATKAITEHKGEVSPTAIPYLVQMGIMTPDEARDSLLTPEQKAARQNAAADAETKRQAAMAADQALQAHGPVQQPVPTQPERQGGLLGTSPGDLLDKIYNKVLLTPEQRLSNMQYNEADPLNPMNILFGQKKQDPRLKKLQGKQMGFTP